MFQSREFKPTDESAQDFLTALQRLTLEAYPDMPFSIDKPKEDTQQLQQKTVQTSELDEFENLSLMVCQ